MASSGDVCHPIFSAACGHLTAGVGRLTGLKRNRRKKKRPEKGTEKRKDWFGENMMNFEIVEIQLSVLILLVSASGEPPTQPRSNRKSGRPGSASCSL